MLANLLPTLLTLQEEEEEVVVEALLILNIFLCNSIWGNFIHIVNVAKFWVLSLLLHNELYDIVIFGVFFSDIIIIFVVKSARPVLWTIVKSAEYCAPMETEHPWPRLTVWLKARQFLKLFIVQVPWLAHQKGSFWNILPTCFLFRGSTSPSGPRMTTKGGEGSQVILKEEGIEMKVNNSS